MKYALLALLLTACGGSTADNPSTAATDSGTQNDSGTTGAKSFKTHVILGDSISDGGGESPFFYTLLDQDLNAKYGGVKVVKVSKGGSKASNLGGQINTITTPLEGPVLVTITIGGNDVQAAIGTIVTGGDDTKQRNDFREFLDAALADLKKPDRFGPGVQVAVYMTNIYDPSDGTGNFKFASGTKCSGALGFYPAGRPTAPTLDPWEQVFTDLAAKYTDVHVLDMRAKFNGHGVPSTDTWFVPDCIHPNAKGHAAIKDLFATTLP
jgi:lysophospholipase L1-like esterase